MATLDPGIILGLKAPQFKSPQEMQGEFAQYQQNELANRLGTAKLKAFDDEQSQNALYRDTVKRFGADSTANYNMLNQAGLGKQAGEYQKQAADGRKSATDAEAAQFKLASERANAFMNIVGSAKDQPSYQMALQQAKALGVDVAGAPPQYDPAFVSNVGAQALTQKERIEAAARSRGLDLTQASQVESARHNKATEGISAGQLGVAREGLKLRQAESASGKVPSGYRANVDGSLSYIPGGPADPARTGEKAPTEGERKAATLLQRLNGSSAQLDTALKESPSSAKPGVLAAGVNAMGLGTAANQITPSARQRVEAAQLDILDAALTLGTGAAYTKEQLEGYRKSYFPQIGDSADTVRDKKDRLDNVISAAKIAAGRAGGQVAQPRQTGATGDWKPSAGAPALPQGWGVKAVP